MNIDISKIWPGWTIAPDEIGSGGYGHVYKAVNESTDAVSAVKIVPVTPTEDEVTKLKLCGKSDAAIQKLCLAKAEKMLAEMEISDHVSFAGLVSPDEVCRYVALMDVACHLSLKEGLPRVAVQALAEGKAVVAYDLDGTPEVVRTGETGVLIRPLDWQGAADALCRLLENPTELERMGQNGRQLVRDLFPWKRMSDILLEDYALLLGKKKKTAK